MPCCPTKGKISGNSRMNQILISGEVGPLWILAPGGQSRLLPGLLSSPSLAFHLPSEVPVVCLLLTFALPG